MHGPIASSTQSFIWMGIGISASATPASSESSTCLTIPTGSSGSSDPSPLRVTSLRPCWPNASPDTTAPPPKPLLLDQTFVAGIGNIYADEALHRAHLHPLRRSRSLATPDVRALWRGIRAALRQGIRHNGASIALV